MSILYLWDADYPWDVRVEKICSSLVDHGFDTHLLARNLKKLPSEEQSGGLHIHRLRYHTNDTLNYVLSFPLFCSPIWLRRMKRIVREHDIELIIVRDLPMCIAAIWIGRLCRVPVLFDMAEDYVAMVRNNWKERRFRGLNLFVRNPHLAKMVERYALPRVQHTMVVVEEMREVVGAGKGTVENTTIVGNTPRLTFFPERTSEPAALAALGPSYRAIYTGGFGWVRGLQTVLEAVPAILKEIPDFLFVVVGDEPARASLERYAADLGVDERIAWLGWVEHRDLVHYISSCDVGIIPHLVTRHVDTTIPNKLFDYMGCGIPVIASNAKPMRRVLEEENAGVVFESGDPDSLADAVIRVHRSTTPFGENGIRAVRDRYNWGEDEKRLLAAVAGVIDHR